MRHWIVTLFLFLSAKIAMSEIGWVGDPRFVAHGCMMIPGEKLHLDVYSICGNKSLCSGKMNCFFIHKDKLKRDLNWIKYTEKNKAGIDSWIRGEAPALCLPKNNSCDDLNYSVCANTPPEAMDCSMTKTLSPSFQTIPKTTGNVK